MKGLGKKRLLKSQRIKGRKKTSWVRIFNYMPSFLLVLLKVIIGLVSLCILSALFLGTYDFLINARYFRLDNIVIKGVDERLKQEIIDMAQLRDNISLISLDLKRLKTRIMVHPWVKDVDIKKKYPHELIIKIKKHIPLAIVYQDDFYYMDRQGEIFKKVASDENFDLPLITGLSTKEEKRASQLNMVVDIINILNFHPPPLSIENLSEIHVEHEDTVLLFFRSLYVPIRANVNNFEDEIEELLKLITYLRENNLLERVERIDLDYPDSAVVSFKDKEEYVLDNNSPENTISQDEQYTKQEHI